MNMLLVSLLMALSQATSQPPAPSPTEQGQPPQEQTNTKGGGPNNAQTVTITVNPQADSPEQTTQEADGESSGNWWFTGLMVFFTFILAVATIVLVRVGSLQRDTLEDTLATNKDIERAYVAMSHNPPGVVISSGVVTTNENPIPSQDVKVDVRVQNLGNTPANITYTLLQIHITNRPLPAEPPYDQTEGRVIRTSLLKTDDFTLHGKWTIPAENIARINREPRWNLYVLAYIDYIDKFWRRHRVGYARVYDPRATDNNNLPFVTQPNYNYDRPRAKDEGNDWDETPRPSEPSVGRLRRIFGLRK